MTHEGIDLQVRRGEICALTGGSGSGKSTLLREMILLQQPNEGSIRVLGQDLAGLPDGPALAPAFGTSMLKVERRFHCAPSARH